MSRSISVPGSGLLAVYSAILLLVFHSALVIYINSSFIDQFVTTDSIGMFYIASASVCVLLFLFISQVLQRVGNYRIMLALILVNAMAIVGMGFAKTIAVAVPLFLVHITVLPLIFFNLDVFFEGMVGNQEHTTGSKRGLLLALSSSIGAVSPLLAGFIVEHRGFGDAYFTSAAMLLPLVMILLFYSKYFRDPAYKEIRTFDAFRAFWIRQHIRTVFCANLLLQIFFCFTVVYVPLYLTTVLNLPWSTVGFIFFCGQLAYVIAEYPIGYIADRYLGEKEMMAAGFVILAVTSSLLATYHEPAVASLITLFFITRIGASLVEVTTESYFFKHMRSTDSEIISFFRISQPLSYVIGAIIGSISLLFLPFSLVFVVVGFIMILGIVLALSLLDTK